MTTSISKFRDLTLTTTIPIWKSATWEEYLAYRDDANIEIIRVHFDRDRLLVEMGSEGINHSSIDLNRWRVPNLVGEIGDKTLATDLDEKKHLYASLEIPEYWVVDVRGIRVIAFQ